MNKQIEIFLKSLSIYDDINYRNLILLKRKNDIIYINVKKYIDFSTILTLEKFEKCIEFLKEIKEILTIDKTNNYNEEIVIYYLTKLNNILINFFGGKNKYTKIFKEYAIKYYPKYENIIKIYNYLNINNIPNNYISNFKFYNLDIEFSINNIESFYYIFYYRLLYLNNLWLLSIIKIYKDSYEINTNKMEIYELLESDNIDIIIMYLNNNNINQIIFEYDL